MHPEVPSEQFAPAAPLPVSHNITPTQSKGFSRPLLRPSQFHLAFRPQSKSRVAVALCRCLGFSLVCSGRSSDRQVIPTGLARPSPPRGFQRNRPHRGGAWLPTRPSHSLTHPLLLSSLARTPPRSFTPKGNCPPKIYLGGNMYDSSRSARPLWSAASTFSKSLTDNIPRYRLCASRINK